MGFACLPGCRLQAIDCPRHTAAQPPFASHCRRCMLGRDAWPHGFRWQHNLQQVLLSAILGSRSRCGQHATWTRCSRADTAWTVWKVLVHWP
eukprot:12098878-Alexandrium_andersonii.AAC.1